MGTPWLVVSTWLPLSTRTRSSEPIVALTLASTFPSPTFSEAINSDDVLAVASTDGGNCVCPIIGQQAPSPYSLALLGFAGICCASVCCPATFFTNASETSVSKPNVFGTLVEDAPD